MHTRNVVRIAFLLGAMVLLGGLHYWRTDVRAEVQSPPAAPPLTPPATPTCTYPSPWVAGADLPATTYDYAYVQVGGNDLYLAGDYGTHLLHYNAVSNTWDTLATLPARIDKAAAGYNPNLHRIYMAGGTYTSQNLYIYDVPGNTWFSGPAMPLARHGAGSAVYGSRLYIAGGADDTGAPTSTLQYFDFTSQTWGTGPALPAPYYLGGYRQVGTYLYLIGSFNGGAHSTVSQRLDLATLTWSTGPAWTPARADFGLAWDTSAGNMLYALGGDLNQRGTAEVDALNLDDWPGGAWTHVLPDLPAALRGNTGGFTTTGRTGGEIWSTGGILDNGQRFVQHVYRAPSGACLTATPSNTSTRTPVPTGTPTQTSTPTPTGSPCAWPGSGTPGPWTAGPPIPTPVTSYAFAQNGDDFYVIGGRAAGGAVRALQHYSARTNTWSALAAAPSGTFLSAPAASYWNGQIYLLEGNGSFRFYIYDLSLDSWSQGPDVPGPARQGAAMAAWNNQVYVVGGQGDPSVPAPVAIYNIATNTWATGPTAPAYFYYGGYTQVGQHLYLVGSSTIYIQGSFSATTMRLDMATNSWSTGPSWTARRIQFGLAYWSGQLYALGGYDPVTQADSAAVDTLEVGAWPTGGWQPSPPQLPSPRESNSAGFDSQGRIWSTGGIGPLAEHLYRTAGGACASPTPSVTPCTTCPSVTPTRTLTRTVTPTVTPTPSATCAPAGWHGPWVLDGYMPAVAADYGFAQIGAAFYVIGGRANGGVLDSFYRYDSATRTWATLSPLPVARDGVAAASDGSKIYAAGGGGSNRLDIYNIATGTWTTGANLIYPRSGAAAAYANGFFWVVGGSDGTGPTATLQIYSPATNQWLIGASAPVPFWLGGYTQLGQYLYMVGSYGTSPAFNSTVTMRYDFNAGAWSLGPAWTAQRADFGLAALNGRLFALGGDTSGGTYDDPSTEVDELDPSNWPAGAWSTSSPPLPTARQANLGSFTSTGRIWSTGGFLAGPDGTDEQWYRNDQSPGYCQPTLVPTVTGTPTQTGTPRPTNTVAPTATVTATASATPSCGPGAGRYRILVVYADNPPTTLRSQLQAEYGVTQVDLFDAGSGTPTLAQLLPYDGVLAYDYLNWQDAAAVGDVLAAYQDAGGVVLTTDWVWFSDSAHEINGRWRSDGYSPFGITTSVSSNASSLGSYDATHPLMQGIITLNTDRQLSVPLVAGATGVATYTNGLPLAAVKTTAGHTTVALNAYLGPNGAHFGQWAQLIVNALRWLRPAPACSTATPGPTTATPSATMTPTSTATVPTATSTGTPTSTLTTTAVAPTASATNSPTRTPLVPPATLTASPTTTPGTATSIATNTATETIVAPTGIPPTTPTNPPTATAIVTTRTPTSTAVAPSPTRTGGPTSTPTNTPVAPPPGPTSTAVAPTGTPTYPAAASATAAAIIPTGSPTARPAASLTTTPVAPVATATPCVPNFSDVGPSAYFYSPVGYLACRGVISGYADGTFRPYNQVTRAQMVKIVVLGFNQAITPPAPGSYTFTDVPPANPFFRVIETAAAGHSVAGYTCGGAGEPCDAAQRPYFRPYTNVTRGQLAKIDAVAAGWALQNPATATFSDVPPGAPFYSFVETAACRGVVGGYADGTFRPGAPATRGQVAKIVYLSITGSGGGPCGPVFTTK